ncbi:MAG: NADPH-dependent FMN reductase [Granulosicoccus sp.]
MKRLLAFAASNSRNSINRYLVDYAALLFQDSDKRQAEIEFLDLNDFEMPIYSIDRENENGIPDLAHSFFNEINSADALLVAFAEHNGSVTAAWKNVFDWMSRIDTKVWQNKPMVIMAASPGPRAGAGVLGHIATMAPYFGGNIKGSVGIGRWHDSFDRETMTLTQASDISLLEVALDALHKPDS